MSTTTTITVEYNSVSRDISFTSGVGTSQDIKDTIRAVFNIPSSVDFILLNGNTVTVINPFIVAGSYKLSAAGSVPFAPTDGLDKNEMQKMLDGELYDSGDTLLVNLRSNVKRRIAEFNNCLDANMRNNVMLKDIFGAQGSDVHVEPPLRVDYGCNISVGNKFYSNFGLVILDCAQVKIGNNVMFAPNVQLYTATHPLNAITRQTHEYAKPITIGDNVWLGGNVCVLPGVTIGNGCVVGAGSVVTKDLPPNSVAVGAPAKVIKNIEGNP